MPSSPPAISAVVPTYNRRSTVVRAIDSILAQAPPPDEIVVVDDGSTDGTVGHLRDVFGDAVRLVSQPNGGVSRARRRGIEEATGDWIAFLDSDDEWLPGKLAAQSAAALAHPGAAVVFGDLVVEGGEGDDGRTLFAAGGLVCEPPGTVVDRPGEVIEPVMFPLLGSSLIRRHALLAADAFAEGLRSSEDLLLFAQLTRQGPFVAVPEVVLRLYRTDDLAGSSLSRHSANDVDHCRARVEAFRLLAEDNRSARWRALHEEWVRGLCVALAEAGRPGALRASLAQFRFGVSPKGVAFTAVACSRGALRHWGRLRDERLARQPAGPVALDLFGAPAVRLAGRPPAEEGLDVHR